MNDKNENGIVYFSSSFFPVFFIPSRKTSPCLHFSFLSSRSVRSTSLTLTAGGLGEPVIHFSCFQIYSCIKDNANFPNDVNERTN